MGCDARKGKGTCPSPSKDNGNGKGKGKETPRVDGVWQNTRPEAPEDARPPPRAVMGTVVPKAPPVAPRRRGLRLLRAGPLRLGRRERAPAVLGWAGRPRRNRVERDLEVLAGAHALRHGHLDLLAVLQLHRHAPPRPEALRARDRDDVRLAGHDPPRRRPRNPRVRRELRGARRAGGLLRPRRASCCMQLLPARRVKGRICCYSCGYASWTSCCRVVWSQRREDMTRDAVPAGHLPVVRQHRCRLLPKHLPGCCYGSSGSTAQP